jgi:hypothetical protein
MSKENTSNIDRVRYILTLFYDEDSAISEGDVLELHRELGKITSPRDKTEIAMVLHSDGGSASSAYKIVNMIRSKCAYLKIIVPENAKSAATLMALGADEIVMGRESELGPLDLPIEHPLQEGIFLSALDGVNCLEYLSSVAANMSFELGLKIRQEVGISRKDSMEIATNFSRGFIEPIVRQLDPLVINMCYRSLHIAERYGKDILKSGMCKNDTDAEKKAEDIIHNLVWNYPEHSFAICSQEAKGLGLKIICSEEYEYWDKIWELHTELLKQNKKIIHLINMDALNNQLQKGEISKNIQ